MNFIKFIHATFKMDKYKDNHIPTYMLDNMENLLSYVGNPTTLPIPHGSAQPTKLMHEGML